MPVDVDALALCGNVPQEVEDQPSDGVPVPRGQVGVEELVHLVDGHAGVHPVLAIRKRLYWRVLDVVLVDDLAHELLDQVLEGHEAGRAAVLVGDDGHVELLVLHLPHELCHPFGLGHEVSLAYQATNLRVAPAVEVGPHQVLAVDHAGDVVDVALVHGDAAVPRPHANLDDV